MAISNFIPEVWAAQMLVDFKEQSIAAGLVNRQYEGEASKGNTVNITAAIDVTITDYAGAGRTTSAEAVTDDNLQLVIDQEKSFDFYIDDIDRAQAAGTMDAFTTSAAVGLAEDADKYLFALAASNADTGNILTPSAITDGEGAWNVLRDLRKKLNLCKVPQANRVVVINSEFEALLLDASSKLTAVDTAGDPSALREATLGRLLGFTVIMSENLPVTNDPQALAFYQPAIAYVSQIEKTEALRASDKFADRLRGLHVYGGKVIRPKGVAMWVSS